MVPEERGRGAVSADLVLREIVDEEGQRSFVVRELAHMDCYGCCFAKPGHKPGDGGTALCPHSADLICGTDHTIAVRDLDTYTTQRVTLKLTGRPS